ncbi:MAG: hypothetical protein VX910_09980 [Candidatus Latescibacterota bacterium]|nr:hypothetical protein [Candidatus Latescibacterota bacterium]
MGIEVRAVENVTQRIECARELILAIIFLDIRVPTANGPESLARQIKEHGKEILKDVAVTASVFDQQRRKF